MEHWTFYECWDYSSLHLYTFSGPTDFCTSEKFEPHCNKDEVVIIESAVYGRMEPGKCFPKEEGTFGCSADVKNIIDSLCSGRQSCTVPTFNTELYDTKPCGIGSLGYLSVSYRCMKGTYNVFLCSMIMSLSML